MILGNNLLAKVKTVYLQEGFGALLKKSIRYSYNKRIRSHLPRKTVSYNRISVRAACLGDSTIPWQDTDIPGYESGLVTGIRARVQEDDTVVVVGGGWGISTVAAARQTGKRGRIVTYEGGEETVKKVEDTVQRNNVEDYVSVRHAIVGQAVSLRDDGIGAKAVSPDELPDCDVLVLDCEGAETGILEGMEIRPRAIIVETHGLYGAPEADVRDKLTTAGYDAIESMVAEERLQITCEENGIYVLFAIACD